MTNSDAPSIFNEDLGSLNDLINVKNTESSIPERMLLELIYEDADQPRKEFDPIKLATLTASIKEYGILSPICLRSINSNGQHKINHGARRYRAAIAAGLKDVPYIINDKHDGYGQMIENIQRDNLSPMEIACWISQRIKDGDNKKDIAKKIGMKPNYTTFHLALIDMPPFMLPLYYEKILTSPRGFYELRKAEKLDVDATTNFCNKTINNGSTTLKKIEAFVLSIKPKQTPGSSSISSAKNSGNDEEQKILHNLSGQFHVAVTIDDSKTVGYMMLKQPEHDDKIWINVNDIEISVDVGDITLLGVKKILDN